MPVPRRKNPIASRRRVDDEGEEDGGPDDLLHDDDDSLSEGSLSDDDLVDGSERSRLGSVSPEFTRIGTNGDAAPVVVGDGGAKVARVSATKSQPAVVNGSNDTNIMLNGLKISDAETTEAVDYEAIQTDGDIVHVASPAVVESSAQMDQPQETPLERRRREHDDYKKKRDADPAFVPNRGAFFMHDHRHAGPAANGFRPFGRGRGRGRGGIGGPFAPMHHAPQNEPTDSPWTHDMHDTVLESDHRAPRIPQNHHQNFYQGAVPQAPRGQPVNRSLSSSKVLGKVQIRILLPNMKEPLKSAPTEVMQYTKLPDHRPPLRRDKPVRISLPDHDARYIFPAQDRSFIFIPRAMRPNQQGFGARNRGRSHFGSIGGYSRRTSVFGGSIYGTSYTPSVAMSRRSSLAYEVPRDSIISPTGLSMSRPATQMDGSRPVVRLPPSANLQSNVQAYVAEDQLMAPGEGGNFSDLSAPQNYSLPQKPTFRENRPNSIPMHQPRPQKSVSVADIESPATLSFNPPQQQQQPFHQQVPPQINGNGYAHDTQLHSLSRNASSGTPLSQIPERAIYAQPFQPNPYQQQAYYPQQYPMMAPQQSFYYPQQYGQQMAGQAPSFHPAGQQSSYVSHAPPAQQEATATQAIPQNLVAQEVNGMVYYYDAAQIPAVATFPAYQQPQSYPVQQFGGVVGMGGMMTPSPDGFYVPQPQQGVVYYQQ